LTKESETSGNAGTSSERAETGRAGTEGWERASQLPGLRRWKERALALKAEVHALYFAYRDPRVSWTAKLVLACTLAYALSPIDLIPDFVPILGYLDDFVLVPLGIALSVKLVPPEVLRECREKAKTSEGSRSLGRYGAIAILAVWFLLAAAVLFRMLR